MTIRVDSQSGPVEQQNPIESKIKITLNLTMTRDFTYQARIFQKYRKIIKITIATTIIPPTSPPNTLKATNKATTTTVKCR